MIKFQELVFKFSISPEIRGESFNVSDARLYEKLKSEIFILPSCILANVDKDCYTGLNTHVPLYKYTWNFLNKVESFSYYFILLSGSTSVFFTPNNEILDFLCRSLDCQSFRMQENSTLYLLTCSCVMKSSYLIQVLRGPFNTVSYFAPSNEGAELTIARALSGHFPFLFLKMKIMV